MHRTILAGLLLSGLPTMAQADGVAEALIELRDGAPASLQRAASVLDAADAAGRPNLRQYERKDGSYLLILFPPFRSSPDLNAVADLDLAASEQFARFDRLYPPQGRVKDFAGFVHHEVVDAETGVRYRVALPRERGSAPYPSVDTNAKVGGFCQSLSAPLV